MTFLEMTLSGGVMILAAAIFRAAALRRLPKGTFVALWWAAALRLLIPVRLPSRFSVYTLLEALRPKAASPVPIAPAVTGPSQVLIIPVQPVTAPVTAPQPAPEPIPIWTVIWLIGAAALALWFLIRYVRWRRRFRESLPALACPGAETCLRSRRKVRLRVTDRIAAPLTYGLLRPVILLPRVLDLRDEETVTCVLTHEMAHIRRLDGLLKLALTAALCLHWFNPAVWLLYVLANRDMELRCDEAAVLSMGTDSRERYALALIRLAELQNECVPLCGFSHKSGMEERIKAIMSIKKQSMLACVLALALALGITTAFATSAKPVGPDDPDADLYAQSSAETAAQWDELLAPYASFGLTWKFDDPDLDGNGLTMTYQGHEVRSISDEQTGVWITEHTGNGGFGPGAVDLYVVYENGEPAGLRLATEEEQARFDRDRNLSGDALKAETLANSVRYDGGNIYFTIPEGEGIWSIFIQGRLMTEDGVGQSVRYLEEESEKAEWIPRMTYSFETADAAYDELSMDIKYGNAHYFFDLTLLLPEGQKPLAQEPLPEGKAGIPEGAEMIWPVDGGTISQAQGTRANPGGDGAVTHTGTDIAVEKGTPVYAAGKGTVKEAGFNAQDGNFVRLTHSSSLETFYSHCQGVEVKTGDEVSLGQTIATVGSTGMSTGPHLHFELLVNGESVDPLVYTDERRGTPVQLFWASVGAAHGEDYSYQGNPIVVMQDGTVLSTGIREYGDLLHRGLFVQIQYENGYSTSYYNCEKVLVKTGDAVKTGDVIAYSGEHGCGSTGSPQNTESELEVNARQVAWAAENLVNGDFHRNSKGETYGGAFEIGFMGRDPDLIAATNGELDGYIADAEANFTYYLTTEERLALDNWCQENKVSGWTVPLYDVEHNEIGVFDGIGHGNAPRSFRQVSWEVIQEAWKQGFPNAKGSEPSDRELPFETIEEAQEAVRNGWRWPEPEE